MYLIGGYDGSKYYKDMWESTDGDNWSFVTNIPYRYERKDHQTIVRDGDLYLFGGVNEQNEVLGKVWKYNGSDWTWQQTEREDLFK